jgi:putative addiction module component (TIGR02574 family)
MIRGIRPIRGSNSVGMFDSSSVLFVPSVVRVPPVFRGSAFDPNSRTVVGWVSGDRGVDSVRGPAMSTSTITRQILEKALVLAPAERAALVESLLASLDQPDARIDELWSAEAESRLKAFEEGRMAAIPADEVFAEFDVQ